jgi:ubiquinone/menaquinone biosynthesis C-methylase UbiE/uncharacterized protein YbaR (Trm112 family)
MRLEAGNVYVCPATHNPLAVKSERATDGIIWEGALVHSSGGSYPIHEGIPYLVFPADLPPSDAETLAWYEREADNYDRYIPLTFATFGVDERTERGALIDSLKLTPDAKVLEIGCGTGRDSALIAERLGPDGRLYLQDLSPAMLKKAVERLASRPAGIEFAVANACYLPFPDDFFDAVYHMGALNTFGDIKQAFADVARVTRPGGRVVIGDESMPLWLRETEFGRILMNSNPQYRHSPPLAHLPIEARNVVLRWIVGGVFYAFEFEVGIGEPSADFDFGIPGRRGGTHRTRYYGQLEGVTPMAKALAERAREKSGRSIHRWLSDIVTEVAQRELDEPQRHRMHENGEQRGQG